MDEIDHHDHRVRRCPMLGHEVQFAYCRAPGAPLPCGRVLDCWWEQFDVRGFLQTHYSPQQVRQILAPRQPKVATLIELIQKAQAAADPTADTSPDAPRQAAPRNNAE